MRPSPDRNQEVADRRGAGARLRGRRLVPWNLGLTLAYFLAAKLGLHFALVNPSASVIWPPTGIAIAAVLILGRKVWPGIFAGAWLANATTAGTLATSFGIACGNTLEGVLGAALVARFAGGQRAFERAGNVFRFALLAGIVSPLLSATLGAASLAAGGLVAHGDLGRVWITWWLGDAVGAWVVAPLLMTWGAPSPTRWVRARVLEAALLAACLVGAVLLVFLVQPIAPGTRGNPLTFLCLPPLLWAAFRFAPREVASATMLVAALLVAGTLQGLSSFRSDSLNLTLLFVQSFLGVLAITSLAVCAMVTEFRRVEADLRRRTLDLWRSNEDLDQFATVASHDLQEPMRMVSSYLQLFERRLPGELKPAAKECLEQARSGAERMRELLDGLLAYSRLDSSGSALAPADCGRALERALATLRMVAEEGAATIEVRGTMPVVRGDEAQLAQLFQNLIGNALKFHRPGVPARVEIEAQPQGEAWLFAVHDDGLGIDPSAFERVFLIFQRLHRREDYPGMGLGLAICKKIVTRHGGRIWIESREGPGSTFCFTLPARSAKLVDD